MDKVLEFIYNSTGLDPLLQKKIYLSIGLYLFIWIVAQVFLKVSLKRSNDPKQIYLWQKYTGYGTVLISIVVIGRIWFEGIHSLTTFLGLVSAGIAIALKDPLVNLAGWLFILWRKPFSVGDRIEIGNVKGDVIDQRVFSITLMEIGNWVQAEQSTGRVMLVPNGRVFTETLANYTKGFNYLWDEIGVMVTFESDWKKAKDILLKIGEDADVELSTAAQKNLKVAARQYMIFYNNFTPIVYTSVLDSGVMLSLRYLAEPRRRRGMKQKIWEAVLTEFAQQSTIDFAYPSQRMFINAIEGKSGTKGDVHMSDIAESWQGKKPVHVATPPPVEISEEG